MTCPSCTAAEANPRTGLFHGGCEECQIRAMAHSPALHQSVAAGTVARPLQSALRSLLGAEWKQGLPRVKAWAERIKAA